MSPAILPTPAGVTLRFAARLALTILVAATVFLLLNYGLNAVLAQVDKAPIREHLRTAFAQGDLGIAESRALDRGMGVHQANDCLIFNMAARDAGSAIPLYLFAAQATAELSPEPPGRCELLRNWVLNDPVALSTESWYMRYLHGYRAVAIGLLSVLGVADSRALLKFASYGVFTALCLVQAGLLWRRLRRRHPGVPLATALLAANELAYIGLGLCFLFLFGLPYFGQSISHAPAIVTLGSFLLAWSLLDQRGALDLRRMTGLAIGYGLFTAYFEFLTGYLPVGVVLLCLLVAISDRGTRFETPGALAARLIAVQTAFVGAIAATLILHQIFTALFTADREILISFFRYLAIRMSQDRAGKFADAASTAGTNELGLGEVTTALFNQMPHLGLPDRVSGLASLLLALGIVLTGLGETWLSRATRDAKWRATLIAIALLPLALWIPAFANHSYIHARFMVRILVGVYATAAIMLFWALAARRAAAPAPLTQQPLAKALIQPTDTPDPSR